MGKEKILRSSLMLNCCTIPRAVQFENRFQPNGGGAQLIGISPILIEADVHSAATLHGIGLEQSYSEPGLLLRLVING